MRLIRHAEGGEDVEHTFSHGETEFKSVGREKLPDGKKGAQVFSVPDDVAETLTQFPHWDYVTGEVDSEASKAHDSATKKQIAAQEKEQKRLAGERDAQTQAAREEAEAELDQEREDEIQSRVDDILEEGDGSDDLEEHETEEDEELQAQEQELEEIDGDAEARKELADQEKELTQVPVSNREAAGPGVTRAQRRAARRAASATTPAPRRTRKP